MRGMVGEEKGRERESLAAATRRGEWTEKKESYMREREREM